MAQGGGEKTETRVGKGVSCRIYYLTKEGNNGSIKSGDGCHQHKFKKAHLPDDRIVITFTLICRILSGVESMTCESSLPGVKLQLVSQLESTTSDVRRDMPWHSLYV